MFFLTGRRLKRLVPLPAIHEWTLAATGLDDVAARGVLRGRRRRRGDRGARPRSARPVARVDRGRAAGRVGRRTDPAASRARCAGRSRRGYGWWRALDRLQRFILLKLLTGELRVGVSQTLVVRALAQAARLPADDDRRAADGRLDARPAEWFAGLLSHEQTDDDRSRPYPFFLASPLEDRRSTRSAIARRLAGRMEVGRHPRAAGAARRRRCICGRAAKS